MIGVELNRLDGKYVVEVELGKWGRKEKEFDLKKNQKNGHRLLYMDVEFPKYGGTTDWGQNRSERNSTDHWEGAWSRALASAPSPSYLLVNGPPLRFVISSCPCDFRSSIFNFPSSIVHRSSSFIKLSKSDKSEHRDIGPPQTDDKRCPAMSSMSF